MKNSAPWQQTLRFFPIILLIGLLLGLANYARGAWPTLGQSLVQQTLISGVIGLSLTWLVFFLRKRGASLAEWSAWVLLLGGAALAGVLGTEVERLTSSFLFSSGEYHPLRLDGLHAFNALLSIGLGVAFRKLLAPAEPPAPATPPLTTIPVRAKNQAVELLPVDDILFLEAADNYCYLIDRSGERHFCDHSLAYLGPRLGEQFLRVHRKYLINQLRLKRIAPHLKGRYVLTFSDPAATTLISGATYRDVIRPLIRPE